jgi:hypothetical protein
MRWESGLSDSQVEAQARLLEARGYTEDARRVRAREAEFDEDALENLEDSTGR